MESVVKTAGISTRRLEIYRLNGDRFVVFWALRIGHGVSVLEPR
jgi:hypothetical protein